MHQLTFHALLLYLAYQLTLTRSSNICRPTQTHWASLGRWLAHINGTFTTPFTPYRVKYRKLDFAQIQLNPHVELPLLAGERGCPTHPNLSTTKEPLMTRAICPWYWRLNFNPSRIPTLLPEAICRCREALTGRNGVVYECHETFVDVKVLRFDQFCDQFVEDVESVSFGCVASHQTFRLHNDSDWR